MRRSKFRKLSCESLENRRVMAGNVTAALEGSLMLIEGDNLANEIRVSQNAVGNVTVTGLNGTLVNGLAAVTFINPQLNAAEVRLEDGADRVTVAGLRVANDLNVYLGAGNDFASLSGVVGANAAVYGEQGSDRVQASGLRVGGDFFAELGSEAAQISLSGLTVAGSATLLTDLGADSVNVANSTFGGDLSVETKAGNDVVALNNVSARNLSVTTDLGADRVTLTSVRSREDLNVETGDGADRVVLQTVSSAKSLSVNTDSGNDTVIATAVSAAYDAVFTGGAGVDTFDDNGIFAGVKREVKEFEFFL